MAKEHHVAWADRIGLSKRWEDAIKNCYYSYGTTMFPTHVKAFELLMVNIKEGVALKDKINDYKKIDINNKLDSYKKEWENRYPQQSQNPSYQRDLEIELNKLSAELQFGFMLQLLEDNGFGFYKSTYEEEEKMI